MKLQCNIWSYSERKIQGVNVDDKILGGFEMKVSGDLASYVNFRIVKFLLQKEKGTLVK